MNIELADDSLERICTQDETEKDQPVPLELVGSVTVINAVTCSSPPCTWAEWCGHNHKCWQG